jgi:hypothetical protein
MFHELSESVSDPEVTISGAGAWGGGSNPESGDLCNFNFGTFSSLPKASRRSLRRNNLGSQLSNSADVSSLCTPEPQRRHELFGIVGIVFGPRYCPYRTMVGSS